MAEAEEIDDTTAAATGWVTKLSRSIVASFSSLVAHPMDDATKSNQIVEQPATTISKRTFDWMHFYIGVRVQGKDGKINMSINILLSFYVAQKLLIAYIISHIT